MISCPQCKHQEFEGALFCSQCGAQIFETSDTTATIKSSEIKKVQEISSTTAPPFPSPPPDVEESNVAIYLIDVDETIFVKGDRELTIGRSTEGQMVVPDIDLSPFDAYEAGVSRLHANLAVKGTQVTAKDLGSANGTRLNGKKITAHAEHTLQHGDILTLGKMKVQILIRD